MTEREFKSPCEVGTEISENTLKEIWKDHFEDKPFPNVKAFIIPQDWYAYYDKIEQFPIAKWKNIANCFREYGKKHVESRAKTLHYPKEALLEGEWEFEIWLEEASKDCYNNYYDDLIHELKHIYLGEV